MLFTEQDIDFDTLDGGEFEELCLDLLLKLGFHSPVWRRGGPDSGRDIEVRYTVTNPLVGSYDELWFVECKRYSKGVPPPDLNAKIAWADARQPQHLAVITSSYLTNAARAWLEDIAPQKSYQIRLVEGKSLKRLLLAFPDLVSKYFLDGCLKLIADARNHWQAFGLMPHKSLFPTIHQSIDPRRLSKEDLAFVWCTAHLYDRSWGGDPEDILPWSFSYLVEYLLPHSDSDRSVLSLYEDVQGCRVDEGWCSWSEEDHRYLLAKTQVGTEGEFNHALYCVTSIQFEREAMEVLLIAGETLSVRISHITSDPGESFRRAEEVFLYP